MASSRAERVSRYRVGRTGKAAYSSRSAQPVIRCAGLQGPDEMPLPSLRTAASAAATGAEAPTVTRRQIFGRRVVEGRPINAGYNVDGCRCPGRGGGLLCRTRRPTNRQCDCRGHGGNHYKRQHLLHCFAPAPHGQQIRAPEYTDSLIAVRGVSTTWSDNGERAPKPVRDANHLAATAKCSCHTPELTPQHRWAPSSLPHRVGK